MISITQPTSVEAWHELRRQAVTASAAAALLGVNRYTSPYRLWMEKTGRVPPVEETPAMRRGNAMERVVVDLLADERPEWRIEYPLGNRFYFDTESRIGATPDAFAVDPARAGFGNVQIKTASHDSFARGWVEPETGEIVMPVGYEVQAIVEGWLSGAAWNAVVVASLPRALDRLVEDLIAADGIDPYPVLFALARRWRAAGDLKITVIDVPHHAGIIERLKKEAIAFWAMVDSGATPPLDYRVDAALIAALFPRSAPTEIDLSGDNALPGLLEEREAEKKVIKIAETRVAEIDAEIKAKLGPHERGHHPDWRVSWKTQHRAAYQVAEADIRVLRITRAKP